MFTVQDPGNYSGITLIYSMAKIVSLCLRNRLNAWCETQHVFNDSQYGFRDKRSTVDCAFILYTIIQKMLAIKRFIVLLLIIKHVLIRYQYITCGLN